MTRKAKMKQFLSLFLAAIMVVTLVPANEISVYAEETDKTVAETSISNEETENNDEIVLDISEDCTHEHGEEEISVSSGEIPVETGDLGEIVEPQKAISYVDHVENDPTGKHVFINNWYDKNGYKGWSQTCSYYKTNEKGYCVEQCKYYSYYSAENIKILRIRSDSERIITLKAKREKTSI